MTIERPPIPIEERKPAWRRACLAYREIREAGGSDQEAHEAAVAAHLTVGQACSAPGRLAVIGRDGWTFNRHGRLWFKLVLGLSSADRRADFVSSVGITPRSQSIKFNLRMKPLISTDQTGFGIRPQN